MENPSDKNKKGDKTTNKDSKIKREYIFGGIKEYSLEKIEEEILSESLYLDVFAGSDLAFKENVQKLEKILPALSKLDCVKFNYKVNDFENKKFPQSRQIGVVANQVAEFFPELVKKDEEGHYLVNYSQLSTIAIQAVKELSLELSRSNQRLDDLEIQIKKLLEIKK